MSSNRIHSHWISVPFGWEKKPGVSKIQSEDHGNTKLSLLSPTDVGIKPRRRNKVHSDGLEGISVPFKWEKTPGVSKGDGYENRGSRKLGCLLKELPPPPFRGKSSVKAMKKGAEKDPFVMAFKKCTKSKTNEGSGGDGRLEGGFGLMRRSFRMVSSCKRSIGVRDDVFVASSRS